jgi:hypothetical protein
MFSSRAEGIARGIEGLMPPPRHHQEDDWPSVDGSWEEYRIHVVDSLSRIDQTLEKLWQALSEVKKDVTALKIQWAIWSAAFGFIGASIPIVLDAILRWRETTGR